MHIFKISKTISFIWKTIGLGLSIYKLSSADQSWKRWGSMRTPEAWDKSIKWNLQAYSFEWAWGFKLKGETMKKLQEVEREIERLRDIFADKKKQVRRLEDALSLLASTKEDLLDEIDDLSSKLSYHYQKHKDLS